MQTFSLSNISFEAFGTIAYKKESNYIRAWLGNAVHPNRNFRINGVEYTVPESGSTFIDFSDIVRSLNAGSVTIAVRAGVHTVDFSWNWVSMNGVSPYKNIIPPAKMIVCENLADTIPITINIIEEGFRFVIPFENDVSIEKNKPIQESIYFVDASRFQIMDSSDAVFWQSRISPNPCNCENMAYLEWESEVGTKKGWFFEILDTQKKTINSTSLQKKTNDFDVRKGYELYFRLQTDKFNFQEREYFSDIVISDSIKFKIDGLESEATCVDSAFTNRNDNEFSNLIFNIKVKKYGTI